MAHPAPGYDHNGSGIPRSKNDAVRILKARANLPTTDEGLDRRLMVRFDAWTDPRIMRDFDGYAKSLSGVERKFYSDGPPRLHINVLRCAFALLTAAPLDRARKLAAGEEYGVPVRVGGDAEILLKSVKAQLIRAKRARGASVDVLLKALIKKIAEYIHAIFEIHVKSGARPSRRLYKMFARFASGELRIEKKGRNPWMNAEPDSAYFFSLAEFCIQAAHFGARPGRRWWINLGGLFAALQDVFCVRYHRSGGERRFGEYGDTHFNEKRELSVDLLLKHASWVRSRCKSISSLVRQVTWNAFWAFLDDVQPLSKPPSLEAPSSLFSRRALRRTALRSPEHSARRPPPA